MIEDITNRKILDFKGGKTATFKKLEHFPEEYIEQIKKMKTPPLVIKVNEKNSQEFYTSLRKLVRECDDNVSIYSWDDGKILEPNKKDFLKGEEIIDNVLSGVNPEWTVKQKAAYVHYKMGEIVSYCPDYNFSKISNKNAFLNGEPRNTWTVASKGRGICDGITFLNMSILSRLGIDSEELYAKNHTYLNIKTEEGNIIADPTWDLYRGLFKGKPMYFGRGYEELIESEEPFPAHVVEEPPKNVLSISEQELRELYQSIGIAGKDGKFPAPILGLVKQVNNNPNLQNKKEKLEAFLNGLCSENENGENFRKESYHICELMDMLGACMYNLNINKADYRCVYKNDDKECANPILVFHSGEEELKENVYIFPKKDEENLECMNIREFDEKYKIHDNDARTPFWKAYLDKKIDKEIGKENDIEHDK